MKAKCPHCANGCKECSEGFIEVRFPAAEEGRLFARICNDCGAEAGGGFTSAKMPGYEVPFVRDGSICPACGGSNIRVEYVETDHAD
jgi:hypothetical protein